MRFLRFFECVQTGGGRWGEEDFYTKISPFDHDRMFPNCVKTSFEPFLRADVEGYKVIRNYWITVTSYTCQCVCGPLLQLIFLPGPTAKEENQCACICSLQDVVRGKYRLCPRENSWI